MRDNTIVFYICGDNGASAEGQNGTSANCSPRTTSRTPSSSSSRRWKDRRSGRAGNGQDRQHVSRRLGVGRQYAVPVTPSSSPRTSAAPAIRWSISWPKGIKPDKTPRSQFHHVNDIAPTLYEILGIRPPKVVDGFKQDPIDGVSMAYTFADAKAPDHKKTQYFDNNGSRGIYQDGWFAGTFGPLMPWLPGAPGPGRLGFGQGRVGALRPHQGFLAGRRSRREGTRSGWPKMKEQFLTRRRRRTRSSRSAPGSGCASTRRIVSRRPTRAGSSTPPRPACPSSPRRAWAVRATVTIDAESARTPPECSTRWAEPGGLTLYMDKGDLVYEYNMMIIERYHRPLQGQARRRQAPDRGGRPLASAKPAVAGRSGAQGRRSGSGPHNSKAHRACRIHRQRNVRCRHRPGIAGVDRLLRSPSVRV